jgi:hypothetical protein
MKYLVYLSLLLFCFVDFSYEIFFILDPFEQRCISRNMIQGSNFNGVFFISGEHEVSNKAFIKNENNQIIWQLDGHKNGNFNYAVAAAGKKYYLNKYKVFILYALNPLIIYR